jgi:hypothetical protein
VNFKILFKSKSFIVSKTETRAIDKRLISYNFNKYRVDCHCRPTLKILKSVEIDSMNKKIRWKYKKFGIFIFNFIIEITINITNKGSAKRSKIPINLSPMPKIG